MAKVKDPVEVVATIRQSIEVSTRSSRKLHLHRLRDLFGFQAWSGPRKEHVARLLAEQGIQSFPPLAEASADGWVVLSLPQPPGLPDDHPDKPPTSEFFDYLESVHLDSEIEVEMLFVSPLFHKLGYHEDQEAAGFRFNASDRGYRRPAEADLLYFADATRSITDGEPLVLIECKAQGKGPVAGLDQARSYAYWVKPAYYVTTDANSLTVYHYLGGPVRDKKVLEVKRSEIRERFDEICTVLNPRAARQARIDLIAKLDANPAS